MTTATIIDIRTRQPVPIPLLVTRWQPSKGEKVTVLIAGWEGEAPGRWSATVKGGPIRGQWVVELDHIRGREFAVALSEMRPMDQPEPPRAA